MLKLAFSIVGKSLSNKAASLTAQQFHRAFANSLTETESLDAFKRYVVPAPNRVLLQTAFANFTSYSAATVNFRNDTRAPLLLVAGGKDRIVPSSIVKANFDLYRESKAETDYKEFPEQTHFTFLQETGTKSRTTCSVGHLPLQRVEANRSSQSDRRLVGSTLNLTKGDLHSQVKNSKKRKSPKFSKMSPFERLRKK